METWAATIKEVSSEHLLTPTYTGENVTKKFLVDFWGLENPDVEWYKIERVEENENTEQ